MIVCLSEIQMRLGILFKLTYLFVLAKSGDPRVHSVLVAPPQGRDI